MRFIVWGCGKLGKLVINMLGEKNIAMIIDQDPKKIGSEYNGIPIYSREVLLQKQNKEIPIIITPRVHEEEINNWLNANGIYWGHRFSQEYNALMGFMYQVSQDELANDLQNEKNVNVYGCHILALLVCDWLMQNRKNVSLIINKNEEIMITDYIRKQLNIVVESVNEELNKKNEILIYADEATEYLKHLLNKKFKHTCNFFNLSSQKKMYKYEELNNFKDIHEGKRCFIVATGPSLKMDDLDKLYDNNEICISLNGIFKAFDKTKWRPDYYIISDTNGIMQWYDNIISMDVKHKFIVDTIHCDDRLFCMDNVHKWHMYIEWIDNKLPSFSNDFSSGAYTGSTVTYCALQMAAYMGFKEIYLLGVDCNLYKTQEQQHFIKNYTEKSKDETLDVEKNILAYKSSREYAKMNGINIYNATRGGALEVFKRVDFDSLFEK